METVLEFKEALLGYLRNSRRLEGVRLLAEHPGAEREFPLRGAVIAVGLDSLELGPGGWGDYYGEREDGALYGGEGLLTARFDIYAPRGEAGAGCHRLYETLCDLVMLEEGRQFRFHRMWCGEVGYDKETQAFHLRAKADLRAAMTRRDHSPAATDFLVRKAAEQ